MKPGAGVRARWDRLSPGSKRAAWLALPLGLLLVLGLLFRGAIGDALWPAQRAQELRVQAQAALDAGRLSKADGSGARELFEAALALQPDQIEARDGLKRVAEAALQQARAHARDGRAAHARIALRLARELQAPEAEVATIERLLQQAEGGDARIAQLLARADAALAGGRLDEGDDAALPLYQRAILLQPRNQHALERREDALEELLAPAPAALAAGDLVRAADLIRRAERFDAGHAALPPLRADLGRAFERQERRIERLLASGDTKGAVAACQALRGAAVRDASVACGERVAPRLLEQVRRQAADFHFDVARGLLEQARALGAAPADVAAAEASLQRAIRDAGRLPVAARSSGQRARVAGLLARAEQARARGHWLTPPGDSAWDHLRQARVLAPDDPRVATALRSMLPEARGCTATALRDNDLGRAQACLDAWQQLAPAEAAAVAARRRLAERWLAMGSQRLADGDIAGARAALQRAHSLQPDLAGGADLAERIERASIGGN